MTTSWSKLPDHIVEQAELSSAAVRVYAALVRLKRQRPGARMGARMIAQRAGLSRNHTRRALEELANAKLVRHVFHGSGVAAEWNLPEEEAPAERPRYPQTCPRAGHYLPAGGPVTCPAAAQYLPAGGQVFTHERTETIRERVESDELSLKLRDLQEALTRVLRLKPTSRQLRFLSAVADSDVPMQLAAELAAKHWVDTPPWRLAAIILQEWGAVTLVLRRVKEAREAGEGCFLAPDERRIVERWGTEEEKQWLREGGGGISPARPVPPGVND